MHTPCTDSVDVLGIEHSSRLRFRQHPACTLDEEGAPELEIKGSSIPISPFSVRERWRAEAAASGSVDGRSKRCSAAGRGALTAVLHKCSILEETRSGVEERRASAQTSLS